MTYAPATWKDAQHYMHDVTGLPYNALGLLHATPQGGGYHEGNDLLAAAGRLNTDYSKRESARDRPGTDGSSAIDIGQFDIVLNGRRIRLIQDFNPWLIRQCRANAVDTLWIREVIYTLDGVSVLRWDREGKRSTGDSSHRTHTHISGYRDDENTPKTPLFQRFFAEMTNQSTGDDMDAGQAQALERVDTRVAAIFYGMDANNMIPAPMRGEPNQLKAQIAALSDTVMVLAAAEEARDRAAMTAITALAAGGGVDGAPIVAAIQAAKAETVGMIQTLLAERRELLAKLAELLSKEA